MSNSIPGRRGIGAVNSIDLTSFWFLKKWNEQSINFVGKLLQSPFQPSLGHSSWSCRNWIVQLWWPTGWSFYCQPHRVQCPGPKDQNQCRSSMTGWPIIVKVQGAIHAWGLETTFPSQPLSVPSAGNHESNGNLKQTPRMMPWKVQPEIQKKQHQA